MEKGQAGIGAKQGARWGGSAGYVASEALRDAVGIAVALERPLLIKGEPGTGKTTLAQSIAEALGKELIVWPIKSTTKAQDGLYMYDTVRRLYDAQFGEGDVTDIARYIRLGRLGEAFSAKERPVLLIDEIDKADLEFPNDLLWELDRMEFHIHETNETVRALTRPIVIITSNAEKELPDAFLRRCVFHYIAFPDQDEMLAIVRTHFPALAEGLARAAIERFYELRGMPELQKRPATGELLDWIRALCVSGLDAGMITGELPFLGVLLKKREDMDTYAEVREKGYSLKGFSRPQ